MVKRILALPLIALSLVACVTINIYFPAAAAEEAARTIVRDVLKAEDAAAPQPPAADDKQSGLAAPSPVLVAVGLLVHAMIPEAQAAQADINIDTAAIRAIRASMQARQSALAAFYRSGAIGFDRQGMVAIRDLGAASLADRNRLKKLVADENAERTRLYGEIARANGHPEWEGDVRSTFARVWVEEAPAGYWYQDASGKWVRR